jgi:beta-glucosidase
VKLEGFFCYSPSLIHTKTTEIGVQRGPAKGYFELVGEWRTIADYNNWRTLPSRIAYTNLKPVKITTSNPYAQLNNWQANIEVISERS